MGTSAGNPGGVPVCHVLQVGMLEAAPQVPPIILQPEHTTVRSGWAAEPAGRHQAAHGSSHRLYALSPKRADECIFMNDDESRNSGHCTFQYQTHSSFT